MTSRHAAAIAAVAVLCLGIAGPVGSQSSETDEGDTDLSAINQSIQQLVEILRLHLTQLDQDLELRRIEVAIAALDLRSRAILQKEGRLHGMRGDRDNAEQRRSRVQQQTAELEERLRDTNQTTDGQAHLNLGRALERLSAESEMIESTIWDLDRRILDLQNEIGQERRSLDHLEDMVDEALGSL
jgi:chromosome segregation ATPase